MSKSDFYAVLMLVIALLISLVLACAATQYHWYLFPSELVSYWLITVDAAIALLVVAYSTTRRPVTLTYH